MAKKHLSGSLFNKQTRTQSETSLSAAIAEWLDVHRIYNDRINSGKVEVTKRYFHKTSNTWKNYNQWIHLAKPGTPDRFAIVGGRIVFIEVKRKGEKPRPEQIARHEEIRRAGAVVIVADSFESFVSQFNQVRSDLA